MRHKFAAASIVLVLLAAGGWGLYALGERSAMRTSSSPATAAGRASTQAADATPGDGRRVLYYHDPMVPGAKFDKPGKSPFMDMPLVPVYADSGPGGKDAGGVTVSPRVQQNLGIRTAEVVTGSLAPAIEAVGNVAWNERDVAVVAARANGYVERLFVKAPLDPVAKGQALAALYVPDWVAAQEEYLAVRRMAGGDSSHFDMRPLLDGARQRMRLAGMTDAQIAQVEARGKVEPRLTVVAPIAGVIAELGVREGAAVTTGMPIARINGLSTVWINADLPEALATQVRPGSKVEARTPDGAVVAGKVGALLPEINPQTRTLKVRVEADNADRKLLPGMFATLRFTPAARHDVLLVPSEAIIATGTRTVVMLADGGGRFTPVEVETGIESNGQTEIRKGLKAGQRVVLSGQFLIDSEANLRGIQARQGASPANGASAAPVTPRYPGTGKVEALGKDGITLSHGPIAGLKWPAMTMSFRPPATGVPKGIAVGADVDFEIQPTDDGQYQIVTIVPHRAGAAGGAKP